MSARRLRALLSLAALWGCSARAPLPPVAAPLTPSEDAPFRTQAPQLPPAEAWETPAISVRTLPSGLRSVVVPVPGIHTVSVIYANGQASLHPPGRGRGLAMLTADTLLQGYRSATGEATYDVRVSGQRPFAFTDRDGTFVGFTVVSEALQPAVEVLSRVVGAPLLSDDGVATARALQESYLMDSSRTLHGFLQPIEVELAFGEGHRWAYDHRDWARDLADATAEQVRGFHAQVYHPAASSIIVVGDVAPHDAHRAIENVWASWQKSGPPSVRSTATPSGPENALYAVYVDRQAAELRVIAPLRIEERDRAALGVLPYLLGGSWTGGVMGTLRHEHGVAYDVSGRLHDHGGEGFLVLQTDVPNGHLSKSLARMLDELDRAGREPYDALELTIAKAKFLREVVPRDSVQFAVSLASLEANGWHAERLAALIDEVKALDAEDVRRVAGERLSSERAAVLVVGQFDRFSPSVFGDRSVRRFVTGGMNDD